jgi:hypothetical protein
MERHARPDVQRQDRSPQGAAVAWRAAVAHPGRPVSPPTALLNRADGTPPFKTGAALEMTWHGDRVRVSLHFASLGPEGSAVDFNEAFLLTI